MKKTTKSQRTKLVLRHEAIAVFTLPQLGRAVGGNTFFPPCTVQSEAMLLCNLLNLGAQ
ncbi:MAG TPA: hypothetical protein VH165_07215 [Kofleriaceae bacterium]|jgi:hypothetical protein|nr:hypothetical protein [Kofleriaceae bacterium]